MSAQDNGGPAFPIIHPPVEGVTTGGVEYYGLTLRDYFAAKAMAALIEKTELMIQAVLEGGAHCGTSDDLLALHKSGICQSAYSYADAMLEARQK